MPKLPNGTRPLLRIANIRRDMDEELSFHFEQTVADLVREGYTMSDARDEAARRFGDEHRYRRDLEAIDKGAARHRRWTDRVDAIRQMLVQATRSIARAPGLTAGIALAFALGIGANATMIGIIDRLLLRAPEHIAEPDRIKHLFFERTDPTTGKETDPTISYPDYLDLKRVTAFSDVAAGSGRTLTIGTGMEAHEVRAELVTGNYYRTVGVKPIVGRFPDPESERAGGPNEAVISFAMWQREYAGERGAIGRTLDFGFGPYTIVGVTPRGFTGSELANVDMWLPLHQAAATILPPGWESEADGARGWLWLETLARIAPGVTAAQAEAAATAAHSAGRAASIAAGDWGRNPRVIAGSIIQAQAPNAPGSAAVARLLGIVSLLVLLIACVNVANLLLARAIAQRREVAVRMALGISRRRLVGQIILEAVMLALLGGVAAVAVERWGGGLVRRTLLPDVAWDVVGTSRLVLPAIIALAVIAGIISAIVPAIQVLRRDVADTIRSAGAGGISRGTTRVRSTLALAQTALSVILLVGAGLFVRSLHNVRTLDLGFEPNNLFFAEITTGREGLDATARREVWLRGIERMQKQPGVIAATASSTMPFRASRSTTIRVPGRDSIQWPQSGQPSVHGVTSAYFETMGIRILRGRGISDTDTEGRPPVTVIGERFASWMWPGQDPIGRCFYIGSSERNPPCTTIVGVAENASNNDLREDDMLQYYVPLSQQADSRRPAFWFIRLRSDEPQLVDAVRREIMALDPRIRFAKVLPYQNLIDPRTSAWKLGATMFGVFGALALVLAAIGLYSVLAFDIAQRTRELGLRTALGATAGALVRSVVAHALRVTGIGLALGGTVAIAFAPRLQSMLFETPSRDPATLAAVCVTLLAVTFAAAAGPAWRATRVDPNISLRGD